MQIIHNGQLNQAVFCPSPNFDERPSDQAIDLLVIHGISLPPGEFGGQAVRDLFTNQLDPNQHPYFKEIIHLKVSSHLFIRRQGEIWQFVPFDKRAWHAGQSSFLGKDRCNDYSIGIELEGTDEIPYTQAQYQTLAVCTQTLMKYYPQITLERIVGHSDIAPTRKTDPGMAFDWDHYRDLLKIMLVGKQTT